MDQSYLSDALKTERYFDEESLFDQRKVKVYIRTVSRKSIKIELPAQITLDQLRDIILKKFGIAYNNQVMYLKGTCLNHNMLILLENNWIIHVINLQEVHLPEICIDIKSPSLVKMSNTPSKITISPKIPVKQFIQDHIVPEYQVSSQQILLVQSGRILKQQMSFIEQNIQNGTTITLIHSKKNENSKSTISFSQQSFNQSKINLPKIEIQYQSQNKEVDSISVQTIEKSQKKNQNMKKPLKMPQFKLQNRNLSNRRDFSQKTLLNRQDSSKTLGLSTLTCSHAKNITIQIGERQCNCDKDKHKQRSTFTESKEPKFITAEDKKRLSKEIREQNLQKLIRMKQKKQEVIQSQSIETQKKCLLKKAKSLQEFKVGSFTERNKKQKVVANPEKTIEKLNFT